MPNSLDTQEAVIKRMRNADIRSAISIAEKCGLSPWSHKNYLDELARKDSIMLCLRLEEPDIVGFIVGRIVKGATDEPSFVAEIYNVGVHPKFQRAGFGQDLLDAFVQACLEGDAGQIWLEVRAANLTARTFYERNDFQKITVRKSFYSQPIDDAVIMRKILQQSVKLT